MSQDDLITKAGLRMSPALDRAIRDKLRATGQTYQEVGRRLFAEWVGRPELAEIERRPSPACEACGNGRGLDRSLCHRCTKRWRRAGEPDVAEWIEWYTRECMDCGVRINTRQYQNYGSRQRYCDDCLAYRAEYATWEPIGEASVCIVCGRAFTVSREHRTTCSAACRDERKKHVVRMSQRRGRDRHPRPGRNTGAM